MSPRLQFSLRWFLVVAGIVAVLLSIVADQLIRQRQRVARKAKIESLIDEYNVTVAAEDDRVFLLNGNADSSMEGFLNADEYYFQFRGELSGELTDGALDEIVREHQHLKILDLRDTLVTPHGLTLLAELKALDSLAVDASVCNEVGLRELSQLSGLRRLVIDGEISTEHLDDLKDRLQGCEITMR